MPAFVHITLKLEGMRKPQSFGLYPYDGTDYLRLQSATRFMRVNLRTGEAILSKAHSNGSYGVDLMPERGAYKVQISPDDLKTLQEHLWKASGVQTSGILSIENKELFSE